MAERRGLGTRTEVVLVVGLIALGAALRVQGIASHPLWIDEHGTWWAVAGDGLAELWHRVVVIHGQSPLYYGLVDALVGLAGATPLTLRLVSLLFGVGLLVLAVPLACATLGRRAVVPALAAFALNERLVFYSQEARPYALALFCAALSCLAWLALLREPGGVRARARYLLATVACFYTHYLFGLLVLVQAAHWWVERALARRGRSLASDLRPWLPTAALLALLLLPALPQLADLFARRAALDWVRQPSSPLELLEGSFGSPMLAWTAGATLLALCLTRAIALPERRSGAALAALWLALPFAIVFLLPPLLGVSLAHRRYVALALPSVPLLYGLLMSLPARGSRLAWLPLLVFLTVSGLDLIPRYQTTGLFSERYLAEPWARAVSVLLKGHRPGDPIFYATHFVELDAVAQGLASPETDSFSAWPVAAYLPPERRASLRALPYRTDPALEPVYRARIEEAANVPRSFLIGKQPVIGHFLRLTLRDPRLQVVARRRMGKLYLFQLRGRSDIAD